MILKKCKLTSWEEYPKTSFSFLSLTNSNKFSELRSLKVLFILSKLKWLRNLISLSNWICLLSLNTIGFSIIHSLREISAFFEEIFSIILKFLSNLVINTFLSNLSLLSVFIYYINNIFYIFGLTDKIPVYLSVFFPIIFLSIVSTIGLVRINEK